MATAQGDAGVLPSAQQDLRWPWWHHVAPPLVGGLNPSEKYESQMGL